MTCTACQKVFNQTNNLKEVFRYCLLNIFDIFKFFTSHNLTPKLHTVNLIQTDYFVKMSWTNPHLLSSQNHVHFVEGWRRHMKVSRRKPKIWRKKPIFIYIYINFLPKKNTFFFVLPIEEISLGPELSSPPHFRTQREVPWASRTKSEWTEILVSNIGFLDVWPCILPVWQEKNILLKYKICFCSKQNLRQTSWNSIQVSGKS